MHSLYYPLKDLLDILEITQQQCLLYKTQRKLQDTQKVTI